jgi:hypothetical protein
LDRTLQGITVTNGLFTLSIDTSAQPGETPLTFDAPYLVEVVLGGSSGGRVGQQVFSSMPYAFGSENALNLNSIGPLAYATKGHGLETPGTSSFTIDGSAETKASQDQLLIQNDSSGSFQTVFSLDENGDLKSLRNIQATSEILSLSGLDIRRVNSAGNSVSVFQVTSFGDLFAINSEFPGRLSVLGTLKVTGSLKGAGLTSSTFDFNGDLQVNSSLEFLTGSVIQLQGASNPVGISHQIEDHDQSSGSLMQSRLQTLTSNKIVDSSFHVHPFENGEVSQFNDDTLDGNMIKDGSLKDSDFQSSDSSLLILDTQLGSISTLGKILLSALPAEVAQTGLNNNFTSPFPQTLNEFDQVKSKAISIISTLDERESGAFPLLRFLDNIPQGSTNLFELSVLSSGDLLWSAGIQGGATSGFSFLSPGGSGNKPKTFFNAGNIRFEDLDGNSSVSFFDSAMIEDGSLTGEDFANQAIDSSKIIDYDSNISNSGVGFADFSTQAVASADLAGSFTSRVFSDLGSSAGAAITSLELEDATLLSDNFADEAVTTNKIKDAAIDSASRFGTLILTDGKIKDGAVTNEKLHDLQSSPSDFLQGDDFALASITSSKISTVFADRLDLSKISAEVLDSRTLPMQISTDAAVILTLINSNLTEPMLLARLQLMNFSSATDYSPALEIQDNLGNRILSLNTNGSISLSFSTGSLVPVTLEPNLMATLFGISDKNGDCGLGDQKMQLLVGASSDFRYDCISKNLNHGVPAQSYFDAEQVCHSDGYELCDANQYLRACALNLLTTGEHLLSQGLAGASTAITFDVLNGANNCSDDSNDYSFSSVASTSASTGFRCCLK